MTGEYVGIKLHKTHSQLNGLFIRKMLFNANGMLWGFIDKTNSIEIGREGAFRFANVWMRIDEDDDRN